jgi:hypothetical protein
VPFRAAGPGVSITLQPATWRGAPKLLDTFGRDAGELDVESVQRFDLCQVLQTFVIDRSPQQIQMFQPRQPGNLG